MHRNLPAALILVCMGLFGCYRPISIPVHEDRHGRYSGVGIYGPSKQWTRIVAAQPTKDPKLAQPIDDQVIIVVQDSATGEYAPAVI